MTCFFHFNLYFVCCRYLFQPWQSSGPRKCEILNPLSQLQNGLKIWTHFSKDDIQMASRYMKRFSMLLIIRKMQIKTTMRYHFIPIRKVIMNKNQKPKLAKKQNNCWQGWIKTGSLVYSRWMVKRCSSCGKERSAPRKMKQWLNVCSSNASGYEL